jgi:hypothetical protein
MKVVCIDTNFRMAGIREQLEYGKVYEASFVFFIGSTLTDPNDYSGNGRTNWLPVEWESNYLNLEGFSEIDWFPTKNFVTIDIWRQRMLDEILSTQKQLHVITTSEIREGKLNDLGI